MIDMNSKIGRLYDTPVGRDVIDKVLMQLGMSESLVTNPFVRNMKLKNAAKLAKGKVDESFFDTLLTLVNSETDTPFFSKEEITPAWWKEAVFYQIYPRTFYDSNGDGIGDLRGITSKLDYLKDLGIDALWLSPIYDSPNDDNGYDIRDYRKIMSEFGTMEDFDELLKEIHNRGMRLIMDLVINHTSDEHIWFQEALNNPDSPYRQYYFIREGSPCTPPNNWTSFFSGPAWNYYPEQGVWALHLFSKKQMDLNWDNPALRADLIEMINWWLNKGVDGFRMDVINYVSKVDGLPDGNPLVGDLMGFTGIEQYYYGPNLHKYMREINEKAFAPHNAFSVGETPGLGMNQCNLLTAQERGELDMAFSFDHLETPGHVRYDDYEYDLTFYRDLMIKWMNGYGNNCRMSLFFNNHDNPRMVGKVSKDKSMWPHVMKLLCVLQMTLNGTPFIFQGDEMGLANYEFSSMDQITDVEAKGLYRALLAKGMTPSEAFKKICLGTREHARVLLPWNKTIPSYHKGLTQEINESITAFFKKIIALRKSAQALIYGDFKVLDKAGTRFTFSRSYGSEKYIIDCNLSAMPCPEWKTALGSELMISGRANRDDANTAASGANTAAAAAANISGDTAANAAALGKLGPYEARVWRCL